MIFCSRLFRAPTIELVLSDEYVTQLSQSNEKFSMTSLHELYICCAVEPLFISGISSNDVSTNPDLLPMCLARIGKYLSSSSLLPSVAKPYQRVEDNSSFKSLTMSFATAPVNIWDVLVRPHEYLFAIFESGNILLNNLEVWSAVAKGRLCSTKNPEKRISALVTF